MLRLLLYRYFLYFFAANTALTFSVAQAQEGATCTNCKSNSLSPAIQKLVNTEQAFQNINSIDDFTFLNPEFIEKMDLKKLAELIVKRIIDRCESIRSPKAKATNADIMMLVPEKAIPGIIAYGFQNQHNTATTNGDRKIEERFRAEMDHIMLGLPYSAKTRELLPKYALEQFANNKHGSFAFPSQYGSVVFKFKDAVKKRSTWSMRDSLLLRRSASIFKTDAETEQTLPLRTNPADTEGPCIEYCEAQVWGPLDLTDVDAVYIPEGQKISENLKSLGVNIYFYKSTKAANKTNVQYTDVLAFSAPAAAPATAKKPASAPQELSRREIEKRQKQTQSIVEKNILSSLQIQKMSDKELISGFRKKLQDAFKKSPNYYSDIFSEEARMLAELSARPNSKASQEVFDEVLKHDVPTHLLSNYRVMALTALMDQPLDTIRPYLIRELGSSNNYQAAVYMALMHAKDPEIRAALMKNRAGKIILDRFENKFCEPDTSTSAAAATSPASNRK